MPILGLYTLSLEYPASTTYMIPSTGCSLLFVSTTLERYKAGNGQREGRRTGERGLGDVGRDDYLATTVFGRREDLRLEVGGHLRVDGEDFERLGVVNLFKSFCATRSGSTTSIPSWSEERRKDEERKEGKTHRR
jgi:hypothetical protein